MGYTHADGEGFLHFVLIWQMMPHFTNFPILSLPDWVWHSLILKFSQNLYC